MTIFVILMTIFVIIIPYISPLISIILAYFPIFLKIELIDQVPQ